MKPKDEETMADLEQKTKSGRLKTSTRHLTKDDNKILGHNTTRKQEVVGEKDKYGTLKMKTHNSAWTPIVHKPSNEQIFTERRDLVSHWFDIWTDSQRKRFFDVLFQQCNRSQYKFVQTWFQDNVPMQHLDFTTVLPKFLSLYIFSFLDPMSLCRCSQVSWNWKFLSEQDVVWMPKCVKYGWFLPYNPPDNEYGAWKKYYLGCVQTPDYKPVFDTHEFKSVTQPNDVNSKKKTKRMKSSGKSGRISPTTSRGIMDVRPAWVAPSLKPNDLDKSFHAFIHGENPNDPKVPKSALVYHNKWGILKKDHAKAVSKSMDFELGLGSQRRKDGHRVLTTQEDHDIKRLAQRKSLSEVMDVENLGERRRRELVEAPWNPAVHGKRSRMQWFGKQTLSGYEGYPVPDDKRALTQTLPRMISGYESYVLSTEDRTLSRTLPQMGVQEMDNPRVVFISSRVAAADLLDDAVLFGVIPIVYEYEGTTSEALMMKLETTLAGRRARSVGLFCHSEEPGELRLAHGCTVNLQTLDRSDVREFFEVICRRNILPSDQGGQFDIFVPLAACEPGLDILVQLSVRCEMQFSSPTGIIGNYNHVNSDWLIPYKEERPIRIIQPPQMYFCQSKLDVWSNVADQAQEALSSCKRHLQNFFQKTHQDIVSQLTGQVVFDVLGQTEIQGVHKVTQVLSEGLRELGNEDNVNSLEFLGQYLLEKAGVDDLEFTSSLQKSLVRDEYEDPDAEVEQINGHSKRPPRGSEDGQHGGSDGEGEQDYNLDETNRPEEQEFDDYGSDHDGPPKLLSLTDTARPPPETDEELSQHEEGQYDKDMRLETARPPDVQEKAQMEQSEKDQERQRRRRQKERLVKQNDNLRATFGQMTLTGKYERLTTKQFSENPEKRSPIAFEILSSEMEYNRILKAVQNLYVKPLRAALNSNRAIASFQNIQIIFTDLLQILDASSEMLGDLKDRMAEWDASQSCLGDIFVRFCTHLKLYTNFVNNYDVILQCIERTKEQTPAFRAFLKRQEKIPQLKMMTIQELLLLPGRRINEYLELLSWFERHTPSTHQDRGDLANAIETLKVLNRYIHENKTRLDRDRRMLRLQKTILNCPSLLEANRYLIKQQDASNLRPPSDSTIPELRVYQHIEMVGLFLFNDALVITRRTDKHFPFTRAVEHTYRFDSSLALSRLRVRDIPESKYVSFGFKVETPKRALYCCVETAEEKFNFISLLEQSIRAAIDIE